MKPGDLVRYGGIPGNPAFTGCLGVLLRRLQYHSDGDDAQNWDGAPAWWIQFLNDEGPMWTYDEEITLVTKGN